MLAVELAMGLFVELGFLQRHQLALSQHPTILGDLRFQSLQPLLHRLQVVAHPNAAYAKRRHLGAALLQLVGGPRLAPGGLVDGHSHDHRLDLRRGAVLQIGLGACDLGQRKIPTLLIQIPEAIEAIARIAHHSAGLGHAAQLLSQLQQPDLSLDHLTLGGRHDGLPGETGRGAALRLWLRPPASSPTVSNRPSDHVKTSTTQSTDRSCEHSARSSSCRAPERRRPADPDRKEMDLCSGQLDTEAARYPNWLPAGPAPRSKTCGWSGIKQSRS